MHLDQTETISNYVDTINKIYNIEKIYFDSYKQLSTPGGSRYPDVTDAINKRVGKGAMFVNYIGHGGELGLSHERVVELSDIKNWSNYYNMPIFITSTCEFSRFDDPAIISAGMDVFLNSGGGGVALFTTTRLAYAQSNFNLNYSFFQNVFKKMPNGKYPRLGDAVRIAKSNTGISVNNKMFSIFGDPALEFCLPKYLIKTTSKPDTIKALNKVTIQGEITDSNNTIISNFNGIVYPTVFDKYTKISTLGQDQNSEVTEFNQQNSILYKGKASVTNGHFSFTFVVPKDIAYQYGKGKLSYYACTQNNDARGYDKDIIIGGSNKNAPMDAIGPNINLYLNNDKFIFGGITSENPVLLAYVTDSNGINTVGNGIGHDIVAILDDNAESPIILNEFYEADLNNYQKGTIRYQLSKLEEGKHTLKLKVWDAYNNSSETYVEFVVAKSSQIQLEHVLNYPNPFTTHTSFYFEHNQPCCDLEVQIKIFTVSGKLIKTISKTIDTDGFRTNLDEITWDGLDDYGDKLGKGVYIYHLRVKASNGSIVEKYEKLFIL